MHDWGCVTVVSKIIEKHISICSNLTNNSPCISSTLPPLRTSLIKRLPHESYSQLQKLLDASIENSRNTPYRSCGPFVRVSPLYTYIYPHTHNRGRPVVLPLYRLYIYSQHAGRPLKGRCDTHTHARRDINYTAPRRASVIRASDFFSFFLIPERERTWSQYIYQRIIRQSGDRWTVKFLFRREEVKIGLGRLGSLEYSYVGVVF